MKHTHEETGDGSYRWHTPYNTIVSGTAGTLITTDWVKTLSHINTKVRYSVKRIAIGIEESDHFPKKCSPFQKKMNFPEKNEVVSQDLRWKKLMEVGRATWSLRLWKKNVIQQTTDVWDVTVNGTRSGFLGGFFLQRPRLGRRSWGGWNTSGEWLEKRFIRWLKKDSFANSVAPWLNKSTR